jgi:hypothetical protein
LGLASSYQHPIANSNTTTKGNNDLTLGEGKRKGGGLRGERKKGELNTCVLAFIICIFFALL